MSKRIDRINNFRYPISQPTVFDEEELTVLELVSKIAYKINETVGEVNNWIDYLDVFVEAFDKNLQDKVIQTLTDWQDSGLLDVIIDEALQTQMDVLEDETHAKLELFETQLTEKVQKGEYIIDVKDYGAVGDGVTDDTQALLTAIDIARVLNKTLKLNGKHYVTETIDLSDLKTVIGNGALPSTTIRYDRRTYNDIVIGHGWFKDNHPPYSFLIEGLNGDMITSDIANPIVSCNSGSPTINGINIVGWFYNSGQVGFMDRTTESDVYNGTIKTLKNMSILFCGSHGIHIKRGIEYLNWEKVNISCNGGKGVFIENIIYNHPCEYSTFKHLTLDSNYLEGFHILGFHRNIVFDTCNLSRTGQYHLPSQSGKDRSLPSDYKYVKKAIKVEMANGLNGNNLQFINCYGEESQGLFNIISTISQGLLNNLTLESNGFMSLQRNETEQGYTKALLTLEGNYINHVRVNNSFGTHGTYAIYNLNNDLKNLQITGYLKKMYGVNVDSYKQLGDTIIGKDDKIKDISALINRGSGTNSDNRTEYVDLSQYFVGSGKDKGVYPLVLIVNANWQATNNTQHGSYLITVQKGLNHKYKLTYLSFNSASGFTAPPTIDADTGIMALELEAYYQYAVMRLGTNNYIDRSW